MHHDDSFNHINAFLPWHNSLIRLQYIHSPFLQSILGFFCTYHSPPFWIMTWRRCTSPPTPCLSSTRRRRHSVNDEDLDDNLNTIPENNHDERDANLDSVDKPLRRPSGERMTKRPSRDPFTSRLPKWVVTTKLTPPSVQPLHPGWHEVYIVSEEEDERKHAALASKKLFYSLCKWFNPPTSVYIY